MRELFNMLKISNEDILLARDFAALPKEFIKQADSLMIKFLDREEYEKCAIVRDYIEYVNKLNSESSYVECPTNFRQLG